MELSEVQIFIIGAAASLLVWLYKFLTARGYQLSAKALTNIVFVVSGVLAFVFAPVLLPPFPPFVDLATFVPAFLVWAGELLVPLSAFVGFAVMVYNNLLKLVLDKIGGAAKKLVARWRAG